jgi:effector-binding domain-containing protein
VIEKEVNYPIEKVYLQFANLQNFAHWNKLSAESKNISYNFFVPYEGQGSSMSFKDTKNPEIFGDFFIRDARPPKTLHYQLFEGKRHTTYQIDVEFREIAQHKTKIIWSAHTPKQSFFKRILNLISEDIMTKNIDKSINILSEIMSNKVDKENQIAGIKFDTLTVENLQAQILLGVNTEAQNKENALFKNIIESHNKVKNFVMEDLGKREDEFGIPIMLSDPNDFKSNVISYYYGIPLSKKTGISDNNFIFRTLNDSKAYVIYYKGNFSGRIGVIQQLLQKAKRDTMRNGELQEFFIEEPEENKDCVMKIALPVFR